MNTRNFFNDYPSYRVKTKQEIPTMGSKRLFHARLLDADGREIACITTDKYDEIYPYFRTTLEFIETS